MIPSTLGSGRSRLLSICIPSHNRPIQATECVLALLAQADSLPIEILVLDNASDVDYLERLESNATVVRAAHSGLLKIVRHQENIGMSANFMRCFELADAEWLWLLADDDVVHPDAIQRILHGVTTAPAGTGFLHFGATQTQGSRGENTLSGVEELIDYASSSASAFNAIIFITNGVYRLAPFKRLVSVGYHYAHTFVPHLMMLISHMAEGGRMRLTSGTLAQYVVPDVGYSYGMVAGLGVGAHKNILLHLEQAHYQKLEQMFFPHNDFKVILDLFYQCRRDATPYVCRQLVSRYIDYCSIARPTRTVWALRSLAFLLMFPRLVDLALDTLTRTNTTMRRHIEEMRTRYADTPRR